MHVRGTSQLEAVAWSEASSFTTRGTLLDDAGLPIAWAPLTIQVASGSRGREVLPVPTSCTPPSRGHTQGPRISAGGYLVETNERGSFCVRGRADLGGATLRIEFAGSKLYDGTEQVFRVETTRTPLVVSALQFSPEVAEVDLDREVVPVVTTFQLDRREPAHVGVGTPELREGLTILLEDEAGRRLGSTVTGGDGRARFDVKTADLAAPGQGELRARFEGNEALSKATATQSIVRHAQVSLALSHPIEAGDPEAGIPIDLEVQSSRGPVEGGVVEASRDGEPVGTAMVREGRARLLAVFTSDRETSLPLSVRYVSGTPWWRAGQSLSLQVPVRGPGVWRQVAIGALVLAVAGWILGGWRRAPKPAERADEKNKPALPTGRAGVSVVETSDQARGWKGLVTDAHEGTPIAGATITITVPTFEGTGEVARVVTDRGGEFTMDAAVERDARLVVEAPFHSAHAQALPPPSRLSITLVTRRRALIEHLLQWVKRQGAPFEGPPEPTPGHVRRVARRVEETDTERWAGSIEKAAFGPEAVDEELEKEIKGAEPRRPPRGAGV
ncbi:Hypothetical protein CAP_0169 [Chondromyces apiculatus DSM 436]|uniref:Carboxypeptidase regulatory-like domain-containing protein n=1 Tax=Chondromyces apiculatus DSM 436 TaxID=1192034 RepID=A0A017TFM1_9BACT|nr:Hypothetical protein CAP_0169 [Chondromyces apiculatus DSM 436]